jgi:hypothetical protein
MILYLGLNLLSATGTVQTVKVYINLGLLSLRSRLNLLLNPLLLLGLCLKLLLRLPLILLELGRWKIPSPRVSALRLNLGLGLNRYRGISLIPVNPASGAGAIVIPILNSAQIAPFLI